MALLEIRDLVKDYGDVPALRGVGFSLDPGETVALLGPNGAGKSTLIRCLTTLEKPDRGCLELAGVGVADDPAAARRHLGYSGQEPALDKVLTGRETLRFQAGITHVPRAEIPAVVDAGLCRFGLTDAADRLVEGYSGGMKRRLDLAAAMLHRPELLVLDEPSTGLDYEARRELWSVLRNLAREGTAVLLATHDFEEADQVADRCVLMSHGRIVGEGTPEALRRGLGDWVVWAALHEHPEPGDHQRLLELVAGLDAVALPPAPDDPARAFAVRGEPEAGTWADQLQARARGRGLELAAVGQRRPTLQDAYLAATAETAPPAP